METTPTDLQRRPRRALEPVRRGRTVTLTEHGEAMAEIRPLPAPARGGEWTSLHLWPNHRLSAEAEADPDGYIAGQIGGAA